MKKQHLGLIFAAFAVSASSLQGQITVYSQGFDLSSGSSISDLGFTGPNITVSDYTWGAWTNYSVLTNKAASNTGTTSSANTRDTTTLFSSSVDADSAGSSLYFSYTMNGSSTASNGWFNFMLSAGDPSSYSSTSGNDIFVQWDGSGKAFDASGDPTVSTGLAAAGAQDWLVVGRVDFAATGNNDTYFLSVFSTGQDPSVAASGFQASSNARNTTGLLDRFAMSLDDGTLVGNVRVGDSLSAVGVVPEPSTYALFSGLAMLSLVLIRRRLRAA